MPEATCEVVAVRAKNQTPDFQRALPRTPVNSGGPKGPEKSDTVAGEAWGSVRWDVAKPLLRVATTAPRTCAVCLRSLPYPSSPHPLTEPDMPPHLTDEATEAQKVAVISPGCVGWPARPGPESGLPTPRHRCLFPMEKHSPKHMERATTGPPPGRDPGGQLDSADTSQLGEGGKCLYLPPGLKHAP